MADIIECGVCVHFTATQPGAGKCIYNPPNATLIMSQSIGGQTPAVISYWPEVRSGDRCSKAVAKSLGENLTIV